MLEVPQTFYDLIFAPGKGSIKTILYITRPISEISYAHFMKTFGSKSKSYYEAFVLRVKV